MKYSCIFILSPLSIANHMYPIIEVIPWIQLGVNDNQDTSSSLPISVNIGIEYKWITKVNE